MRPGDDGTHPATYRGGPRTLYQWTFRTAILQTVVVTIIALVLVAATQVRVALDALIDEWAAIYVILGTILPIAHIRLVLLVRQGRLVEVRHWNWLLFPIHVVWGSGVFVGIRAAVPIGIGLAMLDAVLLLWLKDAEDIEMDDETQAERPKRLR